MTLGEKLFTIFYQLGFFKMDGCPLDALIKNQKGFYYSQEMEK
jgi:hypothetical protein